MDPSRYLPPGLRRKVRASSFTAHPRPGGDHGHGPRDGGQQSEPGGTTPTVSSQTSTEDREEQTAPVAAPGTERNGTTGPDRMNHRLHTSSQSTDAELASYVSDSATSNGEIPSFTARTVERFRRKLKFFFMNPYEKWKARRKFPWKLVLQLVKIVLATIQLSTFGFSRSSHVNFLEKSNIAFKHLYLKDWNPSFETLPYPPATGSYAIYTIPVFYDHVDYTLSRYNETESIAVGTYRFNQYNNTAELPQLCNTHYVRGSIAKNSSYDYNSERVTDCITLGPVKKENVSSGEPELVYDTREYLREHNQSINFDNVILLQVKFSLKTVHLKALSKHDRPDCYKFNIEIRFENQEHDGQMQVQLQSVEVPLECAGHVAYPTDEEALTVVGSIFDVVVILVSIGSMVLCVRSLFRGNKLRRKTVSFFEQHFGKRLDLSDQVEFIDFWYVLIIINDVLTICGSIIKIEIENKLSNNYEPCGALLGTGSLLVWFGVLRYLGFFEKYNVLILTLKKSAPNVLRFLLCAIVFYLGFAFCGWVVLGPYHMKFRQISTASECLFSLVNGDDMFVTFSIIGTTNNSYVWYYSRVYLYLFISLFIYVVLSVFISVIMDAYETIKYYYENGFPKSELMQFVEECPDDANSPIYRSQEFTETEPGTGICYLSCCYRVDQNEVTDHSDQHNTNLADRTGDQTRTSVPEPTTHTLSTPFVHDPDWESDSMESV